MRFRLIEVDVDVTIIGAGMSGICAAIQAARLGQRVALINNRGYLGGNASPEIRIEVCGADGSGEYNLYARESGIIEEIRLENIKRNPQGNVYQWHNVLMDFVTDEENIELFLNTNVDEVEMVEGTDKIAYVAGSQSGSELRFQYNSPVFVDDTGDGTVGYLAGAEYRMGREAKSEYGEKIAPDVADEQVLLSTLSFYSKDTGRKSPFTMPRYAKSMSVEEALENREIPDKDPNSTRFEGYRMQWFYETGHGNHMVHDTEQITREHRELVYGIWDYIKNSGQYDSENYDLEYVSSIPGKRESRRLMGDYVLTENNLIEQTDFDDVIGHGGWSIDLHALKGFFSKDLINRHYILKGIYQIPLRSIYTKDVSNLLMPSRCMSTSHVAFGSTRVMNTLSTLGQGSGAVAYLCNKYNVSPREVGQNHLKELQEVLITNDHFLIGVKHDDIDNLLKKANLQVSSSKACEMKNVNEYVALDSKYAIILPVTKVLDSIDLNLKVKNDTNLVYNIYSPKKKENYNPGELLATMNVDVKASSQGQWVTLPVGFDSDSNKLFIELLANDEVELGFSDEKMNGVFGMVMRYLGRRTTYSDIDTLELRTDLYYQTETLPAFTTSPAMNIFGKEMIHNGYTRNYGLPNIWLSDDMEKDSEPTLTYTFDQKTGLNEVSLTFDSDLNARYHNLEIYYEDNDIKPLVKAYDVIGLVDGETKVLAQVDNNYMRVNTHKFDTIEVTELKVVVKETYGDKKAGIYDIRAYKK